MGIFARFPNGLKKVLVFSYDDGVRQDRKLVEIFNKYGVKCTFNISSGLFDKEYHPELSKGRMSLKEAKELYLNTGHEIAVHGLYHEEQLLLKDSQLVNEIRQDRENLENFTGGMVRGMAYPYGKVDDRVEACARLCGIVYGRTAVSTHNFTLPSNWLRLNVTCHHDDEKLPELCNIFLEKDTTRFGHSRLFYIFGHGYEFDLDTTRQNFDTFEEYVKRLANREDVWYATTIELYDYIKNFNDLIVSADGKKVYNPTSVPIWFWETPTHNEYVIMPNETIELK